jgi:hypothetical protein
MAPETLWNSVLTAAIALLGWIFKSFADEQKRQQILLNKTREELAREYVTKAEVHTDINRVMLRLEALDAKIDRLIERSGGK